MKLAKLYMLVYRLYTPDSKYHYYGICRQGEEKRTLEYHKKLSLEKNPKTHIHRKMQEIGPWEIEKIQDVSVQKWQVK